MATVQTIVLVIRTYVNRPLTRFKHVHHINGDKLDNRIENLELLLNSEHQIVHQAHERLNTPEAISKRWENR